MRRITGRHYTRHYTRNYTRHYTRHYTTHYTKNWLQETEENHNSFSTVNTFSLKMLTETFSENVKVSNEKKNMQCYFKDCTLHFYHCFLKAYTLNKNTLKTRIILPDWIKTTHFAELWADNVYPLITVN